MKKEIADKIFLLVPEEGFGTGNVLLIEDEIRLLIDTGARGALRDANPSYIDMVINSHHHIDHISGNSSCVRAEFYIHELELEAINSVSKMTATDGWDDLMGNENIDKKQHLKGKSFAKDYENLHFNGTVHDGEKISCGRVSFEVIHLPGHTPGHCAFFFPEIDFLFLSDLCLTKFGPWYGDTDSSIDDLLHSIDRVLEMKLFMAVTSHRKEIFSGAREINTELQQFKERVLKREEEIFNFIKSSPADFEAIVRQRYIYPVHPMGFLLFWEKCMVRNHLRRLKANSMVSEDEKGLYYAL